MYFFKGSLLPKRDIPLKSQSQCNNINTCTPSSFSPLLFIVRAKTNQRSNFSPWVKCFTYLFCRQMRSDLTRRSLARYQRVHGRTADIIHPTRRGRMVDLHAILSQPPGWVERISYCRANWSKQQSLRLAGGNAIITNNHGKTRRHQTFWLVICRNP